MWAGLGTVLAGLIAGLALISPQFGYDVRVHDMPVFAAAALLCAAGALYLLLPPLIRATRDDDAACRTFLPLVLIVGALMRLALLPSEPLLEDDYQRYLWDGAQTAAGLNPYAATA